jgi:hypothetical protein
VNGTASSLAGGQLVTSFLKSPVMPADPAEWLPYAVAEGELEVDPTTPTKAKIRGGARMVRDVVMNPFEGDSVALVLYPQYPVGRYFVDFGNPVHKVAIECDGARWHSYRRDGARSGRMLAAISARDPG